MKKKFFLGLLVVFLLWAMIQRPAEAADVTRNAGSWTWDATTMVFDGLIDMGGRLFGTSDSV